VPEQITTHLQSRLQTVTGNGFENA